MWVITWLIPCKTQIFKSTWSPLCDIGETVVSSVSELLPDRGWRVLGTVISFFKKFQTNHSIMIHVLLTLYLILLWRKTYPNGNPMKTSKWIANYLQPNNLNKLLVIRDFLCYTQTSVIVIFEESMTYCRAVSLLIHKHPWKVWTELMTWQH